MSAGWGEQAAGVAGVFEFKTVVDGLRMVLFLIMTNTSISK